MRGSYSHAILFVVYFYGSIHKRRTASILRGDILEEREDFFFLDAEGNISYNEICETCQRDCKQSFLAIVLLCPEYRPKNKDTKL